MRFSPALHALAACIVFNISPADAHSWVEQLTAISSDGTFTGNPGFPRGNVLRTDPKFAAGGDPLMVNQLPPLSQGTTITPQNNMCKDSQQQQTQTSGSPRLKVPAGSMVALQYQENGHVTLPETQPGKPDSSRGTVYIYGTTQPKTDEKFLDVHKVWNADGSGGDKRGKLLAAMPYDDGRCYQVNPSKISGTRQGQFKFPFDKTMGNNLWCQNDLKLPSDAPDGKPYTLYWVWDWPTLPGIDPGLPKGKPEIYTTCMDIDISGQAKAAAAQGTYAQSSTPNMAAIPSYFKQLSQGKNVMQMDAAPSGSPSSAAPSSVPAKASPAPASSSPAAAAPPAVVTTTVHDTVTVTAHDTISVTAGSPSSAPARAPASSSAPAAPAASSSTTGRPFFSLRPSSTTTALAAASSTPSAATSQRLGSSSSCSSSMAAPTTLSVSTAPAATAPPPASTELPRYTVTVSSASAMATQSKPASVSTIAAGPQSSAKAALPAASSSVPAAPPASTPTPPTAIKRRCYSSAAKARRSVVEAREESRKVHENKGGENLVGV